MTPPPYDYLVIRLPADAEEAGDLLRKHGAHGWRVVGVAHEDRVILERPMQPEAAPGAE